MNTHKHGSGLISIGLKFIQSNEILRNISRTCVHLWLISLCLFTFSADAVTQVRPVYDRGATGLGQLLKRLNTSASVLMIGAHPDDEDTALLAYLARGENARTAYLSLTRGDGGQNIIGPELGESLGVIRTEELLQARRLDGAEQYFTRAYDYGFSKTLAEAKQKWDEKIILCDVVRVIRQFRPLVVVSQFSGTPADGHGQHQYSGYISPLAVKAAADSTQCSDAGPAWTVRKFYMRHRGQAEPRLRINTGKYDPLLGRSYFEIAMEARSQHKSQEQGVLELKGEQFSGLNLVGSEAKETSIFDGLDISLSGMTYIGGTDAARAPWLQTVQRTIEAAIGELDIQKPEKIVQHLATGYSLAVRGESDTIYPHEKSFFRNKQGQFADAIKLAAGIQIDAVADRETVVPGETTYVGVRTYLPLKDTVKGREILVNTPSGWTAAKAEPPTPPQQQGFFRRETGDFSAYFNLAVPQGEMPTQPYWLKSPRNGDVFDWSSAGNAATLPFDPVSPRAIVKLEVLGTMIEFQQPVEFRFADDTRGEIRRNINVVPAVSVDVDQTLLIMPYSDKAVTRTISMSITSNSTRPVSGNASLSLESDSRWKITPSSKPFELTRKGEKLSISFEVSVLPRTPQGSYKVATIADIGESAAPPTMHTIAYPHIQTHRYYTPALTNVRVIDLKTSLVKVGYIQGSGDRVSESIRQMGFSIVMISASELASGDLSKYDSIVVGIRAYQVRPDVVANNKRLLDFANNGGTLIVQYQLPAYAQQNLTPFPAQMGPRVADENAAIKIMFPEHPIFNYPNKITDADFSGWVQERNLYNFSTMDARYTGLLESHDTGETENRGGLVVADVGKGKYIYCSYSMFRQLPAGVPGAYRLFANVLSFSKLRR